MRIQSGQLVALGYGAYVRSDEVTAIEPIIDGRGPGRRTLVWVRGLPDAVVASRAEGSIVDELVTPAEEAARMKAQRSVLQRIVGVVGQVSPSIRRLLAEESGVDIDELLQEADRVLG